MGVQAVLCMCGRVDILPGLCHVAPSGTMITRDFGYLDESSSRHSLVQSISTGAIHNSTELLFNDSINISSIGGMIGMSIIFFIFSGGITSDGSLIGPLCA